MSMSGEPKLPEGASYKDLRDFDHNRKEPLIRREGDSDVEEEVSTEDMVNDFVKQLPLPPIKPRSYWKAKEPNGKLPEMQKPVTTVRFTYTRTDKCRKKEDCIALLQKLQQEQMEKGAQDINFNFLVGGDNGHVFEGRGWHYDSERPESMDHLKGKCIDIAFIGNYELGSLPFVLEHNGVDIIQLGQKEGLLVDTRDLKIVPLSEAREEDTHKYL